MSSDQRRFKPGDIVRSLSGLSHNWTRGIPMQVDTVDSTGWLDVVPFQTTELFMGRCTRLWVLAADCELDVFLNAAHKAAQDA